MRSPGPAGVAGTIVLAAALLLVGAPSELDAQRGPFRHGDHVGRIDCSSCHGNGQPTVSTNRSWCQTCHHSERASEGCTACHDPGPLRRRTLEVERTIELSVAPFRIRRLPFSHGSHRDVSCAECHTDPPALGAEQLSCSGCHDEHHQVDRTCTACHQDEPAEDAHPTTEAHFTCSGSGCHEPPPFEPAPRSRSSCLVCHQDLADHHPEEDCAECHTLPPPRGH